jgi:hypothetical protein
MLALIASAFIYCRNVAWSTRHDKSKPSLHHWFEMSQLLMLSYVTKILACFLLVFEIYKNPKVESKVTERLKLSRSLGGNYGLSAQKCAPRARTLAIHGAGNYISPYVICQIEHS